MMVKRKLSAAAKAARKKVHNIKRSGLESVASSSDLAPTVDSATSSSPGLPSTPADVKEAYR